VPVIAISQSEDLCGIEAAVLAGAQGLIPITASFKIAAAALRLVLAGGTYYPHPFGSSRDPEVAMLNAPLDSSGELPDDVLARPVLPEGVLQVGCVDEKDPNGLNAAFTAREVDVLTALQQGRSNKWIAHHLNLSENTIKVH